MKAEGKRQKAENNGGKWKNQLRDRERRPIDPNTKKHRVTNMNGPPRKPWDKPRDLGKRTKQFALRIIRLYVSLPKTPEAKLIGHQLLKAGTSVGAHYREASRGRSSAEFAAKMNGGLMELEESSYWLELLVEAEIVPAKRLAPLQEEAQELKAIFVSCINNAKRHSR